MTFRPWALAACLAAAVATPPAAAVSATAEVTAESALLGLQLAARRSAARGKLPAAQLACFQALQPRDYFETAEQIVAAALSPADVAEADAFFTSAPGRKYARHGLLGLYTALGLKTPEPLPSFSADEVQAIEAFQATPAGLALVKRQVLGSAAARDALDRQAQALVTRCKATPPAHTE